MPAAHIVLQKARSRFLLLESSRTLAMTGPGSQPNTTTPGSPLAVGNARTNGDEEPLYLGVCFTHSALNCSTTWVACFQRQSLACMQGHCHATERQRTGLQTTGSQLIPRPRFLQARLGTTPFSTPSGHVYRRSIRIEDVMHFSRTGCTADFLALCSVELPIALSLAADGKDKQRDDTQLLS